MTEVVPVDRTKLLHQKRQECTSIVRSRKRKLRELFAVATTTDGVPKHSLADPDRQPLTPAEQDFLEHNDILLGKKLNEQFIPTRSILRLDFASKPVHKPSALQNNSTAFAQPKKDFSHDVRHSPAPASPSPASARPPVVEKQSPVIQQNDSHSPAAHAIRPDLQAKTSPAAPNGIASRTASPQVQSKPSPSLNNQLGSQVSTLSRSTDVGALANGSVQAVHNASATTTSQSNGPLKLEESAVNKSEQAAPTVPTTVVGPSAASPPIGSGGTGASHATSPDTQLNGIAKPGHGALKADSGQQARKTSTSSTEKKPQPDLNRQNPVNGNSPASPSVGATMPKTTTTNMSPQIQNRPVPVSKPMPASHQGPAVKKIAMSNGQIKSATPGASTSVVPTETMRPASSNASSSTSSRPASEAPFAKPADLPRPQSAAAIQHISLKTSPQKAPPLTERPYEPLQLGPSVNSHQRSVSEVLAQSPVGSVAENQAGSVDSHIGPITPISQSSKARPRGVQKSKAKDKSKMSMVVFGKQLGRGTEKTKALVQSRPKSSQGLSEDYFTPLFVQSFASSSKWMKPLDQILHQAHKTVSTPDSYTQILDNQACRVLRRVYHLQHHDKWSLRQPKRCLEPTRPPSHWDVLLKEMKWMRTDFRQERKWKMAAARSMAHACAGWVAAPESARKEMQVPAMIPPRFMADDKLDIPMGDVDDSNDLVNHPTPDLIPSAESESLVDEEEPHQNILETVAPSAIFSLQHDDLVFPMQHSPNTDRLLEELPMYGSPLTVPKADIVNPDFDPDAAWRRPALPLSRFVEGEMKLTSSTPPRKRSRYQHLLEDEDEDDGETVFGDASEGQGQAQPQNPDVALFRSENRMMRDRLHACHQFRPPNEHSMPFQTFYESRSPSQWTQSEDDELKSLVREYSYNWSLISSNLSTKSLFVSGAERRTPWECFERWVMLEGLPHDMQKTQYFKLWQNRIESAQQLVRQQAQNALQQSQQHQSQQPPTASSGGPVTPLPRRRQSIPLKVERRRNQKHLTMIDAMRKLAKKRETALAKQQQAASLAAMRKAQSNEASQPRQPTKTPREYSIMRWERDQAMAERLAERVAQHQQRQDAQRRAAIQARAQQGQAAQLAAQHAAQTAQVAPQMATAQAHGNMARPNPQVHAAANGQARPRVPMQAVANGTGAPSHANGSLVPPKSMNSNGQVQMPVVNGQARMAIPNQQANIQLLMQAQRIQEQQRQSVQNQQQAQQHQPQLQQQQQQAQQHQALQSAQQQQQHQIHQAQQGNIQMQNSPPAMRAAALAQQHKFMNNPQAQALLASMNAANGAGLSTPPTPGFNVPATGAGSPPAANPGISQQPHPTYVSQLQLIENRIRQSQPNVPQEMVRQMARQLLQNQQNTLMQSAINAAAGGAAGQTAAANGPHQYAQLLRAQQQQQAQAAAAAQAQQVQQQSQSQQQQVAHNGQMQGQGQGSPALAQQQLAQQRAQQQAQQQTQQQNAQAQRNSSGSATPTPAVAK